MDAHFIPRFYLRLFTDVQRPESIWVYEKGYPYIREGHPKTMAIREDYYIVKHSDGRRDDGLERLLGDIENRAARLIPLLGSGKTLNTADKEALAMFIAALIVRVPSFREHYNGLMSAHMAGTMRFVAEDPERFENMTAWLEATTDFRADMPVNELREFMLSGDYDVGFEDPDQSSLNAFRVLGSIVQ